MGTVNFTSNSLRYKLVVDYDNDDISIVDSLGTELNSLYGFVLANCKTILKVSVNNTIIYQNANWVAGLFTSPDITSSTWTHSLGNIPRNAQGDVLEGNYKIEAKFTNGSNAYSVTKAIQYSFTAPTVEINMSVNPVTAILTSSDVTNYSVQGVSPSIVRSHKLVKPEGSGYVFGTPQPEQVTSLATRQLGGGLLSANALWSRVWTASISSVLDYALQYWGDKVMLQVKCTILGQDSLDVRSSLLSENLYLAFNAFIERWKVACGRSGNTPSTVIASRLQPKVINLLSAYSKLLMARENGEDTQSAYQEIVSLLNSEGFVFTSDDTTKMVTPAASSTIGGGSSSFNFGNGITEPTGGTSGDYYLLTTTMTLYYNSGGTWVSLGSLKGTTGESARTAHTLLVDYTSTSLVSTADEQLVVEKIIDISALGIVAGDRFKITVGLSTDNGNPKVSLYQKVNDVLLASQMDITPHSATDYIMETEIVVNTNADAAHYNRYKFDNMGDNGYGQLNTAIFGATTLNWKLYQTKIDTMAVTNARVNYIIVEHIPYL